MLATITQLATALSTIPQPVALLRSVRNESGTIVDFRWTYLNEAAASAIPAGSDLVGTTLLAAYPGHPRDLLAAYAAVVETGAPYAADDVRYDFTWEANRDDPERIVAVRATKVDDGLAICWTDVTEAS